MVLILGSAMLWMEEHVVISAKVGSALVIASSIGADVFPILLGQTITDVPMIFAYLTLAIVAGFVTIFCVAYATAGKLSKHR